MPSIRIKREYASLPGYDFPDAQRPNRPRSRSLAHILNPLQPPDNSRPQDDNPPDSNVSHRQPSKIQRHIMSRTLVPATLRKRSASEPGRSPSSSTNGHEGPSGHAMITLEGVSENIQIEGQDSGEPSRVGSALSLPEGSYADPQEEHHTDDIVEHLDVIDPQIATVSTLTNAANSIVIPPLSFYSRKPVVVLGEPSATDVEKGERSHRDALDRHVEDVLRKRDKFKRVMKGVWSFIQTPMGSIVALYGFLVVFWGTGIVVFLAKFINFHNANTQGFWVEICQQVETGLFTATSIGLIPFRVLDTWRICKIWRDDLPDPIYDVNYVHVLTDKEQDDLHYQQLKFMDSQTWYRPHGTQTHRAFPINTALWICILNDLNSFFQCLLSGCMWGLNRFRRPAWTTATTLPAAFVCGIAAGCLIWWGGKKTKRLEQVEQRLRAALAMDNHDAHINQNNAFTFHPSSATLYPARTRTRTPLAEKDSDTIPIVDRMVVPPAEEIHERFEV
ncbi:hypothetical protein ABKN59_000518 [Abortiporus biennis]